MAVKWLRAALPVEPAHQDEQYARDMLRRSLVAILLLTVVEIETAVLALLAGGGLWRSWALSSVGALTALAAQPKWAREHGRLVAAASVWCSVAVLCARRRRFVCHRALGNVCDRSFDAHRNRFGAISSPRSSGPGRKSRGAGPCVRVDLGRFARLVSRVPHLPEHRI